MEAVKEFHKVPAKNMRGQFASSIAPFEDMKFIVDSCEHCQDRHEFAIDKNFAMRFQDLVFNCPVTGQEVDKKMKD